MSNELVRQAAEAVEDLRKALELWCTRDLAGPNSLNVHRSGPAAVAAADTALRALMSIRDQTSAAVIRYRTAQDARVSEMLAPAVSVLLPELAGMHTTADASGTATASYTCGDCGQVFPVDPSDPIESHGAYLDHQAEHDDDAAEQELS
ncbi:hypothetical protein [Kribbella sp. NBC_00889]|uniref:hypothetical protein n=1 Tax=Kribbella sp. NBC_00889 TaxID=2975974 RepID=UPI00386B46D6|nr:hypothetical protein OG817_22060 [Kribbella sp. NBC_00889]